MTATDRATPVGSSSPMAQRAVLLSLMAAACMLAVGCSKEAPYAVGAKAPSFEAETLQGENTEEIKAATEALTQALHQIASELYEQAAAAEQPPGEDPAAGQQQGESSEQKKKKEGAVDADFEVVDE